MTRKLVVLAGAGASCALDAQQYPTTVGFRESLGDTFSSSELFVQAERFLARVLKDSPPFDIEKILWVLKEFEDFCEPFKSNRASFSRHLFTSNAIQSICGVQNAQSAAAQLALAVQEVDKLVKAINERVYRLYGKLPTEKSLTKTWIPLLNWAERNFELTDVFTTNYDLVIEEALHLFSESKIKTGHKARHGTTIDIPLWRNVDRPTGLLTKLHGSVDWQFGEADSESEPVVRVAGPEFAGNHDLRAIIYPGFKEAPSREPFQLFHSYLTTRLREATHVVVIGFAFRDEYINTLVKQVQNPNRKVVVIDPFPRPIKDYPPLGQIHLLKRSFNEFPELDELIFQS